MNYTIWSAVYADRDNLSAVVSTEEAGLVLLSALDTPEDWSALLDSVVAIQPYPEAPTAYRLYKSIFITRLTSEEAETMEGVLAAADAKLRLMFNSVEYFVSDDPLFATLRAAVAGAIGEPRAAELLAAPTSTV